MINVRFFIKIFGLTFLLAGIGLLVFLSKDKVGKVTPSVNIPMDDVLGASSKRAQQVTGEMIADVGDGVEVAKKQVLNIKIGDIVNTVGRLQKIPQDFQKIQEYIRTEAGDMLKSRK